MLLKFRPEECIFVEKECKNAIPVRAVMSSFEGAADGICSNPSGKVVCL